MSEVIQFEHNWGEAKPAGRATGVMAFLMPVFPILIAALFCAMAGATGGSFVFYAAAIMTIIIVGPICLVSGIFLGVSRLRSSRRWGWAEIIYNSTLLAALVVGYIVQIS